MSASDIPTPDASDAYKSRPGQSSIPVQSDSAAIEATEYDNGGDSDKQLGTSFPSPASFTPALLTPRREG